MIRIVTPEVPVGWLLEAEGFAPGTEFLGADDRRIYGWGTVGDLARASGGGASIMADVTLRPCHVIGDPGGPTQVACGRWVLRFDDDVAGLTRTGDHDSHAIGWQTLLGGSLVDREAARFQRRGPLPDPQPVKVARGCMSCGFLAYVPPSPAPCPNRLPPPHDFL